MVSTAHGIDQCTRQNGAKRKGGDRERKRLASQIEYQNNLSHYSTRY